MYGVDERLIDEFFAAAGEPVGTELRQRIEELAPPPPQGVTDQHEQRRWIVAAMVAGAIVLDQTDEDEEVPDRERREAAWYMARSLFRMRDDLPLEPLPSTGGSTGANIR